MHQAINGTPSILERPERLVRSMLPNPFSGIENAVGRVDSLLDVGCGSASVIKSFKRKIKFTVGVDGHEPSIVESMSQALHNEYRHLDILKIGQTFEPESFDTVLASDVIEHLTKEQGLDLVAQMETIARTRIVIVTPNGSLPQGEYGDNPLQRHQSGWSVKEMRELGYGVVGINGWKALRGEQSVLRFRPRFLWSIVSRLSQYLVRDHPVLAFQILCTKSKQSR